MVGKTQFGDKNRHGKADSSYQPYPHNMIKMALQEN